ncbi:MAG: hypothetical protein AABY22_20585 [Nanoarchaeota archaeon]
MANEITSIDKLIKHKPKDKDCDCDFCKELEAIIDYYYKKLGAKREKTKK